MFKTSRRTFMLGSASLGLTVALPQTAYAQEMRSVTTQYGTYDIPAAPKRVVAIDSRLDLQPALALGLPVIGHGLSEPASWVPNTEGLIFFGGEVNVEQVLAAEPDLIICAAYNPDSAWWPANRLRTFAPLVPTDTQVSWKEAFRGLASLLGMDGAGEAAIAEYEALITDIKTRHAAAIASKVIVAVQPGDGLFHVMNGSKMLQPQVLADLGAQTIPPLPDQRYNSEEVPAEAFADTLAGVDGLLVVTDTPEDLAGLQDNSLWQRLPPVEGGKMLLSNGNINYGSIYSAMQVARMLDELYGLLS